MAKVKFGAMVNDARGKMDGVVYSKNQYGAYVRQKVSPVQPQTVRQTLVRERLGTLAKTFSTVRTAAQQLAWNAFGKVNPVTDVFGDKQTLSGVASYVRLNSTILNAGAAQITDPPANLEVIGLTSMTLTSRPNGTIKAVISGSLTTNVLTLNFAAHTFAVGQSIALSGFAGAGVDLNGQTVVVATAGPATLTAPFVHANIVATGAGVATGQSFLQVAFTGTPLAANRALYIYATQGMKAGMTFMKSFLRFLGVSATAQASPFDATTLYTAKFGNIIAGQKIGVLVSVVDTTKGALTPGLTDNATVPAE